MTMDKSTGGVRLRKMIEKGMIDRPYLWVDTYNQSVSDGLTGTIRARYDCGLFFVTVPHGDPIKF